MCWSVMDVGEMLVADETRLEICPGPVQLVVMLEGINPGIVLLADVFCYLILFLCSFQALYIWNNNREFGMGSFI